MADSSNSHRASLLEPFPLSRSVVLFALCLCTAYCHGAALGAESPVIPANEMAQHDDVRAAILPGSSGLDGGFQMEEALLVASVRAARKFLSILNPLNWLLYLVGAEDDRLAPGSFCNPAAHLDHECTTLFDHIVVGCGATGCPLARTLSEGGKRVLLIERGKERSFSRTPNAMTINGAGRAIQDEDISQAIVTTQGIRTNTANIMGGGTSINMAIVIEEEKEFFEYLNQAYGYNWKMDRVAEAYEWLSRQNYFPMPQDARFGTAWTKALLSRGYTPWTPAGRAYTGGPLPTGYRFRMGYIWGGGSFFNHDEGDFRMASDTLLGPDKGKVRNANLTVLTEHAVQRVRFDASGAVPRAVCIDYRKTAFEDQQTLGTMNTISTGFIGWKAQAYYLLKRAKAALMFYSKTDPEESKIIKRACVGKNGEITLSAGAIHTPLLLMRSGIGSREQLKKISVPPVKELPAVGKNLRDRMFIPINLFTVEKNSSPAYHPSRICEATGVAKLGPDCDDFKIGDRSLKCTLAVAEELYGGNITEGVILGTRYIFPPAFRHHPLVDKAFEIMTYCARHRPLVEHMHDYLPICATIEPMVNCFRRGSAPFYFTSEPKSSGYVALDERGEVEVELNYLKDEQEIFDAIRGMQNLLEALKAPVWRGVVEPISLKSCPVQIMSGVLDLVARVGQEAIGEIFHGPGLHEIRQNLELLLPGNRTVVPLDAPQVSDEADDGIEISQENFDRYVKGLAAIQEKQDKVEAMLRQTQPLPTAGRVKTEADTSRVDWKKILSELRKESLARGDVKKKDKDVCDATCDGSEAPPPHGTLESCSFKDPYHFYSGMCGTGSREDSEGSTELPSGAGELSPTEDPEAFGRFWSNRFRPGSNRDQWQASYPPILPRTDHPEEVAEFVFAFMTSLWHLHGTSKMGEVVDQNFNVIGVDGLSIADASALSKVTRMNPTATLEMMGRYIGLGKLDEWRRQMTSSSPSEFLSEVI
ncbi:GMC oxidoreductase [Besnoitia besnoiti]|uniref:GMC oxidoreductase n=1 Tax=Besnoitia besnoiti TaxID=94643 RepID=A0A2A9MH65_BESBE|nr:GMC oxidoreductase [Besnoitia besnoiti]PFH36504.1 GMC oxidoreductase [Besnoitia besnoiti]